MDAASWEYIASQERDRLAVLTKDQAETRLINDSLAHLGIENSSLSLPARLQFFPEQERAVLARCFEQGKEGNSFYNAVAVYPVAGKILGIRYPEIFDTIYMVAALFGGLISERDACLDIGTCTGFSPLILSSLGIGRWLGIDRSANCIAYAERCAGELGRENAPIFKRLDMDKLPKGSKYRLVLNSRGPVMRAAGTEYAKVASVLEPGGFLVYVDEYIKNESDARKIHSKSGLSLIYRDIVGGWCQATGEYGVYSLSVLCNASAPLPTGEYRTAYETLWSPHFQEYSNYAVKDYPEMKTLCLMREYMCQRV
jgi:hypothetical protein